MPIVGPLSHRHRATQSAAIATPGFGHRQKGDQNGGGQKPDQTAGAGEFPPASTRTQRLGYRGDGTAGRTAGRQPGIRGLPAGTLAAIATTTAAIMGIPSLANAI